MKNVKQHNFLLKETENLVTAQVTEVSSRLSTYPALIWLDMYFACIPASPLNQNPDFRQCPHLLTQHLECTVPH